MGDVLYDIRNIKGTAEDNVDGELRLVFLRWCADMLDGNVYVQQMFCKSDVDFLCRKVYRSAEGKNFGVL